ncbi:MAG: hypothetical protein A2W19_06285 [Spirochaetes bacterium RBG_16_49_21]|nr:MAG: hypothetical protein A2W19_06285 [Spirochaetes bacterium RBG_16_49_21]
MPQGDTSKESKDAKGPVKLTTNIPVLAQYSKKFAIKNIDFNKVIDIGGKGEVLEVQFVLQNLTDDPMDLYIFTIATFEKVERTRSSFEKPVPPTHRIRSFVPYPPDIANFQYPATDGEGNINRDKQGPEKFKFVKFPKNSKAGIDPNTGKPHHLVEKLIVRTTHLSKYRVNYFFFNEVAILIFDSEGKPAFRQLYQLQGTRNR